MAQERAPGELMSEQSQSEKIFQPDMYAGSTFEIGIDSTDMPLIPNGIGRAFWGTGLTTASSIPENVTLEMMMDF